MIATVDAWFVGLVDSAWALPIVLLSTMLDGLVPPIPSETVVVTLGALASSHDDVVLVASVIATATVGAWCGDVLVYLLGRVASPTRWRVLQGRRAQDALAWARRAVDRNALGLIVSARYVPVGRVAVNLTAGSVRLRPSRFLPSAALAAVLWASYTTLLGALAGRWFHGHPLYAAVVGVVAGLLLGTVLDRVVRAVTRVREARRAAQEPATTDPGRAAPGGARPEEPDETSRESSPART